MEIRPMRPGDVAGVRAVDEAAMPHLATEAQHQRARRIQALLAHQQATDPGGCWVAEDAAGVAGVAIAILREDLLGLALFAVRPDAQGVGVGRRLLDAALAYGDGARGAMIMSSQDPRAMRRYARAGFRLLPCVGLGGTVDRSRLPARSRDVRDGDVEDVARTVAASRRVRGASHAVDLPVALSAGRRLLLHGEGDGGFVVHGGGKVYLLAATQESAARELLWAALEDAPPGATIDVDPLTAGQDWAVAVGLEAGLALSPTGPMFVRGDVGPLRPYVPSGAFL